MPSRAPVLQVRLLGPLEVILRGIAIAVDTRKALAIVALVAAEGRPFARDELAAMFWPDADDEAARGALRRTLSALRRAVGTDGLRIDRSQVALDPATSAVDLIDLERLAGSDRLDDLEAAATLARGPFLAGFALRDSPAFDDWQAARSVRVERTVGDLLDRLATARSAGGDPSGAIQAAQRRVEVDPLDEPGQRRVMELLARSGDRAGAIRQYRTLVALFDRELGVAPLRETQDLYESIREDRLVAAPPSVVEARPTPAIEAPARLPLVGRDADLAAIATAARSARRDGRVVVVEGEAGIGKTHLVEAAVGSIQATGGVVIASRGYPTEGGIPYGPIAGLLRAGLSLTDAVDRLAALDEVSRREIGRLVDLPDALRATTAASGSDGLGARVRLLDAIARALTALVAGPAVGAIWLDDLHLVDDPTLEALAYLARRLDGRPLVLIVAWRREDLSAAGAAAADDLARIPGATVRSLERLDRAAIVAMIHAARPGAGATEAFIDSVIADSEGLPLHVAEVLAGDETPGPLPRGVRALLRERIASVDETAAQVLAAAAVLGRSFHLTTVRVVSGRSEDEAVASLEGLVRRGFIRELADAGDGPVGYDFSHGNVRDAVYESTSLARRRLLHRRAAEVLRSDPSVASRDDLAWFALIAVHEREAGRAAEAASAYVDAADRAEAVFASREAIDHLESALGLGWPDAAGAHARIGGLRARLGEYPAAIAALETAAALADPAALPGIEIALGRVQRRRGDLTAAASHIEAALASPGLAPTTQARALVERSIVALRAGDLTLARVAALGAGDLAAGSGDPHLAGLSERLVGLVAQAGGDTATARIALGRSVEMASDDPDPTAAVASLTGLALALAADGATDEGVTAAERAIAICRRIGDRHLEAAVENHLADMLHDAGRPDASMDHLKRAVALFAEIGEGERERDPGIWALAAW